MKTISAVCFLFLAMSIGALEPAKKFPENKWFNGVNGLEDALELQKEFNADIFMYFVSSFPRDQDGLCKWFEKRGLHQPVVDKLLRDYVKVQIRFPLGKKDEEALARYNVKKGPTIIILQPDGKFNYCKVFDWPGNEPKLLEPDQLVETFRSKSSARYQQQPVVETPAPAAP